MNSVVSNFEMGVGGWLGILAGLYMMAKDMSRQRYFMVISSPFVCSFLYWGASVLVRQSLFFGLSTLRSMCRYDSILCILVVMFLSGTVLPTIHQLRVWSAPPAPPSPPSSEPPSEASSEPSSADTSMQESSESDSDDVPASSDESPIQSRRASNVSDRVRVINEDGSDSPLSFEKVGSDDDTATGKKKN